MSVLAFLLQTLRIAVPYLFAAAGGSLAERAGVISLTLEGFMLGGAFGAVIGNYYGGGPWVGVGVGLLAGAFLGAIHAVASIRFRADQVIVGIAINLLAIGATRYFLKLLFDSSSNSPRVSGFAESGRGLLSSFDNPILWVGLLVIPATAWLIYRTPYGLRLRAAG
jgi:simple sugar transport system permease protein